MKLRKILSAFLAATVIAAPVSGAIPYVAMAEGGEVSASVTFGKTIVTNKASVNISSTPQDINYALTGSYEGRGCVITQLQRNSSNNGNLGISHIPIFVDDTYIDSDDRNIAVKLTYFDRDWDTIHVMYNNASGNRLQHDIVKYGTNEWRTATIILRNPKLSNADITVRTGVTVAADIIINAAEDSLLRDTEYISKVEIVNLDKTYSEPLALSKTDILHIAEARALSETGLFEGYDEAEGEKFGLDKPITKEQAAKAVIKLAYEGTEELENATCTAPDVSDEAKSYIGLALKKEIITSEADGSIGADEYVTMKQMLDMFIHIITGAAPSDTYTAATNLKLVKKISGADEHGTTGTGIYNVVPGLWTVEINNLERYAYADDLAAISYNMLYQTVSGRSGKVMKNLYDSGAFTKNKLVATGLGELIYEFYRQTGFELVETSYKDRDTGVTINTLSLPGLPTSGAYAHSMNMSADGKNIVVCTALDTSSNYGLMAVYNRDTKKTTVLHPDYKESYNYGFMVCANTNEIFYTCADELYCFDMNTGENRLIVKQYFDTDDIWAGVPSVTDDGEYFINYAYDREKRTTLSIDRVNTRTGEIDKILDKDDVYALKSFRGNYTPKSIGHVNINPVYKNLYFFILQYVESGAPYEVFVFNSDTGESKCVYSDHMSENGIKDESTSHWVWSEDGEKIYYIKYSTSAYVTELPGVGIMSFDKNGNAIAGPDVCVNGDYAYNHVGVSPDDKHFAGDHISKWSQPNQRFEAKVVLIDGETGKSRLLANKVGIWSSHPGHIHPLISEDHSTLSFTMAGNNHHLMAAYIDLTTLPEHNPDEFRTAYATLGENATEKGIERFYEQYSKDYYSNVYNEDGYIDGEDCLEITSRHKAPFEILAEYIGTDEREVTFRIEYYDNGTDPIKLLYNCSDLYTTSSLRRNQPISFDRTGTNKWLTKDITISDACFNNSGAGNSDFSISAEESADSVYIKSIYAEAGDKISELAKGEAVHFADGTEVDDVTGITGEVTTKVPVKNSYLDKNKIALFAAVYDRLTGRLKDVKADNRLLSKGEAAELSVTVNVPDSDSEYKYFVWNVGTLSPILVTRDVVSSDVPTVLTVVDTTVSTATLSWTAPADNDVAGYKIYRDGVHIGTTKGTSYTDGIIDSGTTYSYQVSAFDAEDNESEKSAVAKATTEEVLSASFDFEKTAYSNALAKGDDGIWASAPTTTVTWVDTFDTKNYDTTYGDTPTISVGKYNGRTCYAAYDLTNSKYGIGFIIVTGHGLREASTDDVAFTFDYFDNGTDKIGLRYRTDSGTGATTNNTIVRTNTNTWKTASITVSNANFTKSGNTTHFFWFSDGAGDNSDPYYISNIKVERGVKAMTAKVTPDSERLSYNDSTSQGYISGGKLVKYSWANNGEEDTNYGITDAPDGSGKVFFMKKTDATSSSAPKLTVHVDDTFVTSADSNIKIRVTYWDDVVTDGNTNRVKLDYAGIEEGSAEVSNIYSLAPVKLYNTRTWKTCEFVLDNACFNGGYANYCKTGDFRLNANYDTPDHSVGEVLYIKSIEVIKY